MNVNETGLTVPFLTPGAWKDAPKVRAAPLGDTDGLQPMHLSSCMPSTGQSSVSIVKTGAEVQGVQ